MKKGAVLLMVAGILVGLSAGSALSYRSGKDGGDGEFAMYVAPATVVQKAPGDGVTIHTDVPLADVADGSVAVAVDGTAVPVNAVFADDRNQLVARVSASDVIEAAASETATITLTLVRDGQVQSASATVRVKA